MVVLNGLQSLHLDFWPTFNVGKGFHPPHQWAEGTWYHPQGVQGGPRGPFWMLIWLKISIFDHLVLLNGLQPLHLDCWPTSNVRIGSHWPHQWVLDARYDQKGATRGSRGPFWWPSWQKISFFDHLVLLNGLQPLHLDCWLASNVGICSHWPHQPVFGTWYDPQGVPRGSRGPFCGRFF